MKKYRVTIELDTFEFIVSAKDKKEAKEKALNMVRKRKFTRLCGKDGPVISGQIFFMEDYST